MSGSSRIARSRRSLAGVQPGVAGILLAAGAGRRLGRPKALVEMGGEPLARRGVDLLREGGAAPVVIVTGAVAVDLPGVLAVHNPDWPTGMGSSLAAGFAAVPDSCDAAVIALVDQPLVGAEAVRRLITAAGRARAWRSRPTAASRATRSCWLASTGPRWPPWPSAMWAPGRSWSRIGNW